MNGMMRQLILRYTSVRAAGATKRLSLIWLMSPPSSFTGRYRVRPGGRPAIDQSCLRCNFFSRNLYAEFLAEQGLHLKTHAHGFPGGIEGHVAPANRLPRRHRALQHHVVRKPNGQRALQQRVHRGHQLAVDGVTALAVQSFACSQVTLGGGRNVAVEPCGRARSLTTHRDAGNRYPKFETDQVIRFVHGSETPTLVRLETIL